MAGDVMDADMPLEEVWADLEAILGDKTPEPVHSEDQSWFSKRQYQERYKQSDSFVRRQLTQWTEDSILETQIQRRGNHNVRCYRAVKKDRPET